MNSKSALLALMIAAASSGAVATEMNLSRTYTAVVPFTCSDCSGSKVATDIFAKIEIESAWKSGSVIKLSESQNGEATTFAPELIEYKVNSIKQVGKNSFEADVKFLYREAARTSADRAEDISSAHATTFAAKASSRSGKVKESFDLERVKVLKNPARENFVTAVTDAANCARAAFAAKPSFNKVVVKGEAGLSVSVEWNYNSEACWSPLFAKARELGISVAETQEAYVVNQYKIGDNEDVALSVDKLIANNILSKLTTDFVLLSPAGQSQINMSANGKFLKHASGHADLGTGRAEDLSEGSNPMELNVLREVCLQSNKNVVVGELGRAPGSMLGCSVEGQNLIAKGLFVHNPVVPLSLFADYMPLSPKYWIMNDGGIVVRDPKKQASPVMTDVTWSNPAIANSDMKVGDYEFRVVFVDYQSYNTRRELVAQVEIDWNALSAEPSRKILAEKAPKEGFANYQDDYNYFDLQTPKNSFHAAGDIGSPIVGVSIKKQFDW